MTDWAHETGARESARDRFVEFARSRCRRGLMDVHREDGETVQAWVQVLDR